MMMPRRLLFGLAARLAALGSAGAVGAKPLVHAIPSDIASLDPADIRGQQDQEIGANIYERLVKMKFNARPDGTLMADPVEVVPELAESWTVEGPVITFKLRPGVKFYATGNPMTVGGRALQLRAADPHRRQRPQPGGHRRPVQGRAGRGASIR